MFQLVLTKKLLFVLFTFPSFSLKIEHIDSLLKQIPSPYLLLGDFTCDVWMQLINHMILQPDPIKYIIKCSNNSLQALLFNHIWTTGDFPEGWRLATVIPKPKPGEDHAKPLNYRPISLTSCLCKTLERMINKRLMWYIESNNLLSLYHLNFRAGLSTNDN